MKLYPKRKGIIPQQDLPAATIITQTLKDSCVATDKLENLAVTNAKIANLAVDTAQIALLAVTNAQINDCSITKLTVGNMTAIGTITTGSLVTGAAGTNRIEITSALIAGYNSSNVLQFYLSASDGKAYAGGGAVILDSQGLSTMGQAVSFFDIDGVFQGYIYGFKQNGLIIQSWGTAIQLWGTGAANILIRSGEDSGDIALLSQVGDITLTPHTGTANRTFVSRLETTNNDVIVSRSFDTVYQNTTNYPKIVTVSGNLPATTGGLTAYVEEGDATPDVLVAVVYNANAAAIISSLTFVVPIGAYYTVNTSDSTETLEAWIEADIGG